MAGIVHGGGLTAAMAQYGGAREDWLDLSTGINPKMPELPDIPTEVWNRLPDQGLVRAAQEAARDWYLGEMLPTAAQRSPIFAEPPSVLPDISPSRGEIRWGTAPAPKEDTQARLVAANYELRRRSGSISPLEGEMSGRTEGGASSDNLAARAFAEEQASDASLNVEKTRTNFLPLPTPGTQSLIQILPRLVPQNRAVAIVAPTYGEYAHCFAAAGFMVELIDRPSDLKPHHGALIVVNPNNPDGRMWDADVLRAVHGGLAARGAHLHVDEAFGDGRPERSLARDACLKPGLTVSRSFGKFFGMAGLRLGFVFAVPETLSKIEAALGPWAVSGPALHLATVLMRRDRRPILERILARKAALERGLSEAGLKVAGGTELFALVETPRAQELFDHLCRSHILVRKFDYAPTWLRIGLAGDEQGDRKLAGALASFTR